ncbi:MAG: hypothetical protein IPN72_07265 [Saprospiraceae bacterium]|nr:hypothetical protein [Saprospiraceae bacterium]
MIAANLLTLIYEKTTAIFGYFCFGGLYDEEFQEITKPLFERIEKSEFEIIFSNITEQELENAPQIIKSTINLLPQNSTLLVKSDLEAAQLPEKYIDEKW